MTKWRPAADTTTGHYPLPSRLVRLAGIAGLVGAVLWPLTILVIAGATQGCTAAACDVDRGSLFVIALAPVLFAITLVGLELRARRFLGLADLIGDLTIGTAAALFVLAFVTGAIGFLGPGLLLLLIGSIIFGFVGYLNGARARLGSVVVGIGAGALVFLLLAGAMSGLGAGIETPWLFALLLYGIGWGWLGGSLLLARPLPIPVKPEPEPRKPARRKERGRP
jgi:hypothetical protein